MSAVCQELGVLVIQIFNCRYSLDGKYASHFQISRWSVKLLRFTIF